MGSVSERQEPRFNTATNVSVQVEGREQLQELWTANISKGGLFVLTREPPAMGSRVSVTLETPDGVLTLQAEVVHVVPPSDDNALMSPGVGLQFSAVTDAQRQAVQSYVDGVARQLEEGSSETAQAGPAAAEVMVVVRALITGLEAGDVFAALQVPKISSRAQLLARADELATLLATVPPDATPAQATRIQSGVRALERIRVHIPKIETAYVPPPTDPIPPDMEMPVGMPPPGDPEVEEAKRVRFEAVNQAKAHAELAKQHMERQSFEASEQEFALAAEKDPNVLAYSVGRAWALAVNPRKPAPKRFEDALAMLLPLLARCRVPDLPYTMGMIHQLNDTHDKAEKCFRAALELDGSHHPSMRMVRLMEARRNK